MATKTIRAKRQAERKRRQVITWGVILGVGLAVVGGYALFALNFQKSAATRYEAGKPGRSEPAPDFSLPMVGGGMFSLADYRGQKNVLLFFQEGVG